MNDKEIEKRWMSEEALKTVNFDSSGEFLETAFIPSQLSYGAVCRFRWKHTPEADKYYLTVKSDGGLVRDELEYKITKEQYDNLTKGLYKKKVRYHNVVDPDTKLKYEYKDMGKFAIIEIEFENEKDANSFKLPEDKADWQDVTDDRSYNFYSQYIQEAEAFYAQQLINSIG